jgi:hypothetical protein
MPAERVAMRQAREIIHLKCQIASNRDPRLVCGPVAGQDAF